MESQLWARGRMDLEPSVSAAHPGRPGGRLFSPADTVASLVVLQGLHHDCSNEMDSHLSHFFFR